jgi:hypothetical protein
MHQSNISQEYPHSIGEILHLLKNEIKDTFKTITEDNAIFQLIPIIFKLTPDISFLFIIFKETVIPLLTPVLCPRGLV